MAPKRWISTELRRTKVGRYEDRGVFRPGKAFFAGFALCSSLAAIFLLWWLPSIAAPNRPEPEKTTASLSLSKPLSDAEVARMSATELTRYVFDHRGCNNCHTLSTNWKLGFTDRGKQNAEGFEGCASLLQAMFVVAQVQPAYRTEEAKEKAASFETFGCATCHEVTSTRMALTTYGAKLKSLHLNCITRPICCAVRK
jgi:hypothetical protein